MILRIGQPPTHLDMSFPKRLPIFIKAPLCLPCKHVHVLHLCVGGRFVIKGEGGPFFGVKWQTFVPEDAGGTVGLWANTPLHILRYVTFS